MQKQAELYRGKAKTVYSTENPDLLVLEFRNDTSAGDGARTAHYVNDNLDEGPIIMQDVIHVDHTYTAEDMMRAGRDVEKNVLSRALYKVLAQRVFVYGNRTIIL